MKPSKEQLQLIDKQVKRLVAGDSYYGKMYREMGLTEINSEEDFYKIPFSSKEDLIGNHGKTGHHPLHQEGCGRLGHHV